MTLSKWSKKYLDPILRLIGRENSDIRQSIERARDYFWRFEYFFLQVSFFLCTLVKSIVGEEEEEEVL